MSIVLEKLTKRYAGHAVVQNLSLEVTEGEFFVLLGSSGSGKTTVLRLVAGLTDPDSGRVVLRGRDVTRHPSQKRNVGFVFQHYALFEHMSVADNVGFGLKIRKAPKTEIAERCAELLDMVGLAGLGGRKPSQLSGGQRQRVALARALAHQPDVLLLDEPLGALDAKIRAELRVTLKRIQAELHLTTILVTHDQSEAFEMGDRLGVMSFGRLLEVGKPAAVYEKPQSEFVATFLGTANLIVGRHSPDGVRLGEQTLSAFPLPHVAPPDRPVQLLFRPEHVALAASREKLDGSAVGVCEVIERTYGGSHERLRLRLPGSAGARQLAPLVPFGRDRTVIEATRSSEEAEALPLAAGTHVWVGVRRAHLIEHPGMRMVILHEDSPSGNAATALGGYLSRHAHARALLIKVRSGSETRVERDRRGEELLGSGVRFDSQRVSAADLESVLATEEEREPIDLLIAGAPLRERHAVISRLLNAAASNVLIVSGEQEEITRGLVCFAVGEPGKRDVGFAGRLLRHIGAEATLLTVVSEGSDQREETRRTRFIDSAIRQLDGYGVPAQARVRTGAIAASVAQEMTQSECDLVVLGAPLPNADCRIVFAGTGPDIVSRVVRPVLIIRYECARRA